MSQESLILSHLRRHKCITPIQALERYGCFRLAARISDLRQSGYVIHTDIVQSGDKRYAKYRLIR